MKAAVLPVAENSEVCTLKRMVGEHQPNVPSQVSISPEQVVYSNDMGVVEILRTEEKEVDRDKGEVCCELERKKYSHRTFVHMLSVEDKL